MVTTSSEVGMNRRGGRHVTEIVGVVLRLLGVAVAQGLHEQQPRITGEHLRHHLVKATAAEHETGRLQLLLQQIQGNVSGNRLQSVIG